MKLLVLTFYFEPDLCAGSFRNTALIQALEPLLGKTDQVDVITTMPNRYASFDATAPSCEKISDNIVVHRIDLPEHKSGFLDQIWSFRAYYTGVWDLLKKIDPSKYDLVYASSSRLFTAYLGARIANKFNIPLYLDIRDIFTDTIDNILNNRIVKKILLPVLCYIEQYTLESATHLNVVSGGFREYFSTYFDGNITEYTNGIDEIFLDFNFNGAPTEKKDKKIITYAGNIGEGQGLHRIVPDAALKLKDEFTFQIIGDGGTREQLNREIEKRNLTNVKVIDPVDRQELLNYYKNSDYLFLHLNDFEAFKKVLPSKIFEYAATNKTIIAGVNGYSRAFLEEEVDAVILFSPCDSNEMVNKLRAHRLKEINRQQFINKYKRSSIMNEMAGSIIEAAI